MRLPQNRGFRALIAGLCAGSLLMGLGLSPAEAAPRKPTQAEIDAAKKAEAEKKAIAAAAQKKLDAANARLRDLSAKAELAKAAYVRSARVLSQRQKELAAAVAKQQAAENTLKQQRDAIGRVAASAYRMGTGFGTLDSLLSADGPQDLIDRMTALGVIGTSNDTLLKRYTAAEAAARTAKAQADKAKKVQAAATAQVAATKQAADAVKSKQQKEVNALLATQNALLRQLAAARNVRVSLEQQRQLAILEEQAATRADNTSNQPKVWGVTGFDGRTTIRATESQRAEAVAFARQEVFSGKPYIWGTQGPKSYDCSGLVYRAYQKAGLPYTTWSRLNSRLFFAATKRITLKELVPGDLLFWSYDGTPSGIHHIAIYAGNGMVYEARNKRAGLKYSNMYGMPGLMPEAGRV